MLPIETVNPLFGRYLYPFANTIRVKQQEITWTAEEIPVKKDIHTYRHILSPAQLGLVTITLQSFVEIEQRVGDVWETIATWYPHAEIGAACSELARMEKAVHAFFYQKMSDELLLVPEDVAKSQQEIKVIRDKLEFINKVVANLSANKPLALATVSFLEQVLLFSNFAMLKSFQANGHSLLANTITGVKYVINDEQLHGAFAQQLFLTVLAEDAQTNQEIDLVVLQEDIHKVLEEIIFFESAIVDYVFQGVTSINDITAEDLKSFVRSRGNSVLVSLGYPEKYIIESDPIAEWFYKDTAGIRMHDFFVSGTTQYKRSWELDSFSRLPFIGEPCE